MNVDKLKEHLIYIPEVGTFLWRTSRRRGKKGDVAGCLRAGYRWIGIEGKVYPAHRLAFLWMTGRWPCTRDVDHINRDPSDNSWANLREATSSQNSSNRPLPKNRSGYKGVKVTKYGYIG